MATREQVSYKLKWGLPQSGGGRKASSQDMMMDDGRGVVLKGATTLNNLVITMEVVINQHCVFPESEWPL